MSRTTHTVDHDTGEILEEQEFPEENRRSQADAAGGRVTTKNLKIDPILCGGLVKQMREQGYDRVPLAKFWGTILRIQPTQDITGKWWKMLYGQFQAQNLATGEIISGSTCFLPGNWHSDAVTVSVEQGLYSMGRNDPEKFDPDVFPELERALAQANENRTRWQPKGVDFVIQFSLVYNETVPLKYSWEGDWLDHPRKTDPLKALRQEALAFAPRRGKPMLVGPTIEQPALPGRGK